ncbi:hypothetical protein I0C86_06755 [Plantactinospora sp. S1510]|uniref:Uncharacterized protein n=1 Tax=Plantactinospora alkalitolerans TaxID=2789879 RepID=A0ABS0GR60_9ACTN|nr:hypothetical protein [Plantactinospora alkalitolerans]MBF9128689.1 hypothetical protein [Plantactinospora alkalitolerans]
MSAVKPGSTIDVTSIPRAVLSVAVGVVHSVERAMIGDARIRTARGNAWEAICADRDRAHRRDEIRALVAVLAATPPAPSVGRVGVGADRQPVN